MPGGPGVRTPHFHCQGREFSPWSENYDPTSQPWRPKQKRKPEPENKPLVQPRVLRDLASATTLPSPHRSPLLFSCSKPHHLLCASNQAPPDPRPFACAGLSSSNALCLLNPIHLSRLSLNILLSVRAPCSCFSFRGLHHNF